MRTVTLIITLALIACSDDTDSGSTDTSTTSADTTAQTDTAVASETTVADTTEPHEVSPGACVDRICGPDPVTHEDCGTCATPGLRACNDGRCEPTCDATDCGAMSYSTNTCVSSGECDGSPDGSITSVDFACSDDGATCDASAGAVDCGLVVTDCSPCDLTGTDDGFCSGDVCKAPGETTCVPVDCVGRVCGPDPDSHRDCGTCSGDNAACNDGTCEALCNVPRCAAMGYTENTCVSSGECDGSPDGAISTFTFTCSLDLKTCDGQAQSVDCGLLNTDCSPCDFSGTDDGLCEGDVCKAADQTQCK